MAGREIGGLASSASRRSGPYFATGIHPVDGREISKRNAGDVSSWNMEVFHEVAPDKIVFIPEASGAVAARVEQ